MGNDPQGRKDDSDKLRYDLIPVGPMAEVARVYTIGAKKYTDRNWELGLKWGRVYSALQRHANAWWRGERNDPIDGQHHLASVAWCALALMEYESTHPELDDRKEPRTSMEILSGSSRKVCFFCGLWYNEEDKHNCFPPPSFHSNSSNV